MSAGASTTATGNARKIALVDPDATRRSFRDIPITQELTVFDALKAPVQIRADLLDVDDNIAETEALANGQSFVVAGRMLRAKGATLHCRKEDFIARFAGVTFSETLRTLADEHKVALLPDEVQEYVDEEREAVIAEMRRAGVRPAPYVEEVLDFLSRELGRPTVWVSSSTRDRLAVTFQQTGLDRFARLRTPEDLGNIVSANSDFTPARPKPDPTCYQHALTAFGLTADQAVAVEDSSSGVGAAIPVLSGNTVAYLGLKSFKMREVLVPKHLKAGVSLFLDDWRRYPELLALLDQGEDGRRRAKEEFSADNLSRSGLRIVG